ncbi:MAG: DNA-binding protein [Thermodesulfobacteriota bacterium]|nr:DNA-binding protein [Thermodesulfobacteriota bacterium]
MPRADLLKGWGEIAQYVGVDVSDTLRLAKLDGLPYFRLGRTVYCRKSWLDAWTKTVSIGTGRFLKARDPASRDE